MRLIWDFYPAEDSNYNLNGVDGQKEIDGFQNSLALLLRAGIVTVFAIYAMHRFGFLTFHRLQSFITQWTEY